MRIQKRQRIQLNFSILDTENIADNGTIEIKSSSTYENNLPRNLVDFDKSNFFQSLNDKTIVCFDLKDKLFQLTDYSIKSHNSGSYSRYHLKDWAVEVSLDGETWEVVQIYPRLSAPKKQILFIVT